MKKGDKVTLRVLLMGHEPGSQGVVRNVHNDGTVTVAITHDPQCNKDTDLLAAQPASCFETGGNCV